MADNITSGGVTYASDDIGAGVQAQRVKPVWGVDGTANDVSATTPLPVNLAASSSGGGQTTQTLSAFSAAPTGATSSTSTWVLDVSQAGNASFHLLTSAFVGTVTFEQSLDPAGAAGTWAAVPVMPEDVTSVPMTSLAINTATAYVRQFTVPMFGPRLFRVRCSAFTSGTLTVLGSSGPGWYEGQPSLAPSTANIGRAGPQTSSTATVTSFTPTASSVVYLAANANRVGYKVTNDSNVDVLINESGGTVSATAYSFRLAAGGYYESSGTNMIYVGAVSGLGVTPGTTTATAATSGACRFTEFV